MNIRLKNWLLPVIAVCYAIGIDVGRISDVIIYGMIALIVGLVAVILFDIRYRVYAVLVCAIAAGCIMGYAAYHPDLPEEGTYTITGIIADEIQVRDSQSTRTVLCQVSADGEPIDGNVYWSFYSDSPDPELYPGVGVCFTGRLYHPSGAENPEGYDFRESLLRQGIKVAVYGLEDLIVTAQPAFSFQGWTAGLRHELSLKCMQALEEETGGYAATMLFGASNLISAEDRSYFSQLGIAHILSVSGFHVGILAGVLLAFFRALRFPQKLRLILYGVFLFLYCALCGFRQPVIRASMLVLLLLFGRIRKRPRSGIHLLAFAFLIQLIISPVQLNGLSFQLSFGAVFGITAVTPFLRKIWTPASKTGQYIYSGLCAGLGAQIGILYPQLYAFQELPLFGLLLNIPVIMIASALIIGYWIVLLTIPIPFLSEMVSGIVSFMTETFITGVRALGKLPGVSLWTCESNLLTITGIIVLIVALSAFFKLELRRRFALAGLGILCVIISLIPAPNYKTEYIQFSVGNADAAVLRDRDRTIVIDTGYDDGVISSYLHRYRLTPDVVILTHLHSDHAGGLKRMMDDRIPIRLCYLPEGAENSLVHPDVLSMLHDLKQNGTEFRYLSKGDVLSLPSGEIRVLWPETAKVRSGQDANIYPLVLKLDIMGTSMLQTADLDGRYEDYVAMPADILKIAHHGSSSSTSEAFMRTTDPQIILLSCGNPERTEQVRNKFPEIPLYSTGTDGACTIRFYPTEYVVESYLK